MDATPAEHIDFRPRKAVGVLFSFFCCVAAPALIWVGFALGPSDVESMDGFNRLLFSVVSIRLFAWAGAILFVGIAILIAASVFRKQPTLTLIPGVGIRAEGRLWRWNEIASIEATETEILISVSQDAPPPKPNGRGKWLNRGLKNSHKLVFSSLALGAGPSEILATIQESRPQGERS